MKFFFQYLVFDRRKYGVVFLTVVVVDKKSELCPGNLVNPMYHCSLSGKV